MSDNLQQMDQQDDEDTILRHLADVGIPTRHIYITRDGVLQIGDMYPPGTFLRTDNEVPEHNCQGACSTCDETCIYDNGKGIESLRRRQD